MVGGWVGDQSLVHDGMSSWAAWGGRRSAGFARGLEREGEGRKEGVRRGGPGIEAVEALGSGAVH